MESEKPTSLQRFASLVWYEAFIEFVFRFVAKTSELLLALGLVFSAADVLSKGQLMGNNPILLYIWAWFQGVGIEASGGIVLVYGLKSVKQHDTIKAWLYLILASLLSIVGGVMLFTQLVASTTGTGKRTTEGRRTATDTRTFSANTDTWEIVRWRDKRELYPCTRVY